MDLKVYRREWKRKRIEAGFCSTCQALPKMTSNSKCERCYRKSQEYRASDRAKVVKKKWHDQNKDRILLLKGQSAVCARHRYKWLVLDHYGPQCCCCGESTFEFLSVDHIDRASFPSEAPRSGKDLYRWLIKNNFPLGIRILCLNCNGAREYYGSCPHQGPSVGRPARPKKGEGILLKLYPREYESLARRSLGGKQ